jgi:flagellar transcriptional activator FlhD
VHGESTLSPATSTATLQGVDDSFDTPWGLLTTTSDGTIVGTNLHFAVWTGRSRDVLCDGLRWKQLLAPASRILYETHFVPRLEAHGAVSEVSLDLVREDGSRFPILASALRQADCTDLMLAQSLIRQDKAQAMVRLGISEEAADLIATLSPSQIMKLASSNMLLSCFRADDDMVWNLLTQHKVPSRSTNESTAMLHANLLMSSRFAEVSA